MPAFCPDSRLTGNTEILSRPVGVTGPPSSMLTEHQPSHRDLARKLVTNPADREHAPAVDAIIMPTSRRLDEPRSGVRLAAEKAAEMERSDGRRPPVVVLCSGAARSEHLPRELLESTSILAVDIVAGGTTALPRMRTADHVLSSYQRSNDVGLKRNLGLAIGRLSGWEQLLLMDDDVTRLTLPNGRKSSHFGRENLADAALALREPGTRAVGWVLDDFPDNSVVCHARGLAGMRQEKFIGGAALLVRCDESLPFFPATYNEDWLFLLPLMLAESAPGQALVEGGILGQDWFSVYKTKRARSEELGDTLGEGLYNLLQVPRDRFAAMSVSTEYWRDVVQNRIAMIEQVYKQLELAGPRPGTGPDEIADAQAALQAALGVHLGDQDGAPRDWSSELAGYCWQWQQDLRVWNTWFTDLQPGSGIGQLGLGAHARWIGRKAPRRTSS
jgi:hypothetical protein